MQSDLARALTSLAKGELLRFEGVQGHAIAVFRGHVWITQNHDSRDIFVRAGETFGLDRPGLVLVEAIEPAALLLFDAAPAIARIPQSSHEFRRRADAERSGAIGEAVARAAKAMVGWLRRWGERTRAATSRAAS